jgi:hypothetical protein
LHFSPRPKKNPSALSRRWAHKIRFAQLQVSRPPTPLQEATTSYRSAVHSCPQYYRPFQVRQPLPPQSVTCHTLEMPVSLA